METMRWEGKKLQCSCIPPTNFGFPQTQNVLLFFGKRKHLRENTEALTYLISPLHHHVPLGAPYLCSLAAFICSKYSENCNIVKLIAI